MTEEEYAALNKIQGAGSWSWRSKAEEAGKDENS